MAERLIEAASGSWSTAAMNQPRRASHVSSPKGKGAVRLGCGSMRHWISKLMKRQEIIDLLAEAPIGEFVMDAFAQFMMQGHITPADRDGRDFDAGPARQ